MRRLHHTLRNILGLILVVALTAGAVWLLAGSRPRPVPSAPEVIAGLPAAPSQQSPLPTPTAPLRAPSASPTPTAAPMPYLFGEPRVVLTHTAAIGISGWLPDSRQLLLTIRRADAITETIETLDVTTGERHVFGERAAMDRSPVWLPSVGKVAFTRLEDLQGDQWGRVDLWISAADAARAREPVLRGVHWAIGGQALPLAAIAYPQAALQSLSDQGQRTDAVEVELRALGLDVEGPLSSLQVVASPTSPTLAVFDRTNFYLVDLKPPRIRRIDLGQEASESRGYGPRHAILARWSPNGRQLALITTIGEPIYSYTSLALLNAASGDQTQVDVGIRYVTDAAWAPDSRHLVILAQVRVDEVGIGHDGLYLANADSGTVQRVLISNEFSGWGLALGWSADGHYLAIRCPRILHTDPPMGEDGLCLVRVERTTAEKNKP